MKTKFIVIKRFIGILLLSSLIIGATLLLGFGVGWTETIAAYAIAIVVTCVVTLAIKLIIE